MDEPPSLDSVIVILLPVIFFCLAGIVLGAAMILLIVESACYTLSPDMMKLWSGSRDDREKMIASMMTHPLRIRLASSTLLMVSRIMLLALAIGGVFILSRSGIFILVASMGLLVFCEVIPRTYGRKNSLKTARRLAIPASRILRFCAPPIDLVMHVRARWKQAFREKTASREDLALALELAAAGDPSAENERDILRGIVNFGTLKVTDLMKPASAISAVSFNTSFENLIVYINQCGYSRIPVYRKTIDNIVGVLYVKDLLPYLDVPNFPWGSMLRPGFFVNESRKIDLLLKDFQEKRVHMAIVRDGSAHTSGLITLEDLIEEIIGEINDENDIADLESYQRVNDNTYLFSGKTPIDEFFRIVDVDPPADSGRRFESLEQFLVEIHDELPTQGDELVYEQLTFVIEQMEQKRIKRVRVNVHQQA